MNIGVASAMIVGAILMAFVLIGIKRGWIK